MEQSRQEEEAQPSPPGLALSFCAFPGVPWPGPAVSRSPEVCCSCLEQAVAHGDSLPRSTGDLLWEQQERPTLHSLPHIPENAASKEMPAAFVACCCSVPSLLADCITYT